MIRAKLTDDIVHRYITDKTMYLSKFFISFRKNRKTRNDYIKETNCMLKNISHNVLQLYLYVTDTDFN